MNVFEEHMWDFGNQLSYWEINRLAWSQENTLGLWWTILKNPTHRDDKYAQK